MKRDLKADLEQVRNFRSKWRQSTSQEETWKIGVVWEGFCRDKAELWLEQGIGEAERAEKAEALARELVEVLRDSNSYIQHHIEYGHIPSPKGDNPLLLHTPGNIRSVLTKAKEVLGDEV